MRQSESIRPFRHIQYLQLLYHTLTRRCESVVKVNGKWQNLTLSSVAFIVSYKYNWPQRFPCCQTENCLTIQWHFSQTNSLAFPDFPESGNLDLVN